jgi:hypothetical protein
MADEWMVRVQGREYGPVDTDTVLEWKAEGRLIPQNEVQRTGTTDWRPAAEFAELFAQPPPVPQEPESLYRRRTLPEIARHSLGVYRHGFGVFVALSLMVALPSFVLKVSLAYLRLRPETGFAGTPPTAILVTLLALPVVIATWFLFIAGLQFTAVEIIAGRAPALGLIVARARQVWGRVTRCGLVVYGSYIFWTLLPLMAIAIVAGSPSIPGLLLALVALAFQVFMVGRLWINFLFWQQASTIADLDAAESLQESRDLARSNSAAPRLERPLYRGAIIASVWLLVMLAANMVVELPFLLARLQGATSLQEIQSLTEQIANATAPDALRIAADALNSLVGAVLRPLLGIAFVLLYLDAKAREQ